MGGEGRGGHNPGMRSCVPATRLSVCLAMRTESETFCEVHPQMKKRKRKPNFLRRFSISLIEYINNNVSCAGIHKSFFFRVMTILSLEIFCEEEVSLRIFFSKLGH